MNKAILIGRLTRDGELKYTPGAGTPVMTFTIAVDNYNSKTRENNADFINIVLWGKSAESLCQWLTKGTQVAVSGRISTRTYDAQDGTKRYITEVVADMFNGVKLLGSRNKNTQGNQGSYGQQADSDYGFNNGYEGEFEDGIIPVDDGTMPF